MAIVGVSFDDPSLNESWAEEEGFSFELWSDLDRTLALTYGAARTENQGAASRITRILDRDGTLLVEYDEVAVGTSPGKVLEDCRTIYGD